MESQGDIIPPVVERFAKTLPRLADGRIDYSESESAPVLTCFVQYRDEILLLKRSNKVRIYQGKWNTVAGYLDELKPLSDKLEEELREELGIALEDILKIKIGEIYEFRDEEVAKTWIIHPALVQLKNKPNIKLDWEHTEYVWITIEEFENFDTVPKLKESLKRVFDF